MKRHIAPALDPKFSTSMKTLSLVLILAVVSPACEAFCQGTLLCTFDGQAVGTSVGVQSYAENGMIFTSFPTNTFFSRHGGGVTTSPENGTAFLRATTGGVSFRFANGSLFGLYSVQLAEYSTVVPNAVTVRFVGYRPDGSTVTRDITTDGIIDGTGPLADFQTFDFANSPQFQGLTRVEISTSGWSLDNLVVIIPEPGSGILCLTGGLALWLLRPRKPRP